MAAWPWYVILLIVALIPAVCIAGFARWIGRRTELKFEEKAKAWEVFVSMTSAITALVDGSIRVQTEDKPLEVNLWQATNPKARDFRLVSVGPAYKKSSLQNRERGAYLAQVPKPATGWTAFFVELVFDRGEKIPFKFTTQVNVVPDLLPHRIDEFRQTIKSGPANRP